MISLDANNINEKTLLQKLKNDFTTIKSLSKLNDLKNQYLGKKGTIKILLKNIGLLSEKEKKEVALSIQRLQKIITQMFDEKEAGFSKLQYENELIEQAEDFGYQTPKVGHLHPVTQTIRLLNKIFMEMGYSVMDGPELESDEYCFQRLNVPQDHPARDMQDTIYIQEPKILLRTQTSSIEARVLEKYKPPFKVVCPGKVYRNEKPNKSNHFIFHHYQGIVVMEKITLRDLFGTINYLFKTIYGPDVKVRFRNKYYPEVEPGVGPDMQCFNCQGKGCAVCKGVGWIEMGGAGIIHPNVMKMAGIDTNKWEGFAFGLGLDRWVMAKYNITDIRTLLGGNLGYKYYENENTL